MLELNQMTITATQSWQQSTGRDLNAFRAVELLSDYRRNIRKQAVNLPGPCSLENQS